MIGWVVSILGLTIGLVYGMLIFRKKEDNAYGVLPGDIKDYRLYYLSLGTLSLVLLLVTVYGYLIKADYSFNTIGREDGTGGLLSQASMEYLGEKLGVEVEEQFYVSKEEGKTVLVGPYQVTKIIDGDTIRVKDEKRNFKVRFIGINTPEIGNCYSYPAKDFLTQAIGKNPVFLEYDISQGYTDKYGRDLAYIWAGDLNLNAEIIKGGYGKEYTYNTPYKYQSAFQAYESNAKKENLGLWNDCK